MPLYNTRLLAAYAALEPAAVELVHAVKKWAKEKEVRSRLVELCSRGA